MIKRLSDFKRPSRNTVLFYATFASLVGIKKYDDYKIAELDAQNLERCESISAEPLDTDFGRKVLYYLPTTKYSRETFDLWVRPLLDQSALDYKLMDIHSLEKLWKGAAIPVLSLPPRTWREYMLSFMFRPEKPYVLPGLNQPLYSPNNSVICQGPTCWRHLTAGLSTTDLNEYPTFGYIPAIDLTGWSFVPGRMLKWFHYRDDHKNVTQAVMQVVLETQRKMTESDVEQPGFVAFEPKDFEEITPEESALINSERAVELKDLKRFKIYSS